MPYNGPLKRTKYRNTPTSGHASKKEAKRAQELRLLEKAGKIRKLREQVRYELIPKQENERAVHYTADFVYCEGDKVVVEDVKSPITRKNPAYILKRKLMLWRHGIRILET